MLFSRLIAFGFLASIFMMFQFSKNCRILNRRKDLTQEEAARFQAKAQRSLAAAGVLLAGCAVFIVLGIIFQ